MSRAALHPTSNRFRPARRGALRAALALAPALVLALAPLAAAQQEAWCEQDGLIVIEVESVPPSGDWVAETSVSGYTGSSYYRWSGPNLFQSPGSGVLTYTIYVSTPGEWEMRYRNYHDDPDHTMENDAWTRMDGGSWIKTYSGPGEIWTFHTRHEYSHDNKDDAHYFLDEGFHTFQISGRSNDFRIDRIHFYLSDGPVQENASSPVSPFGDCEGQLPHPAAQPRSVTAVFADGTLGGLQMKLGDVDIAPNGVKPGAHLAFGGAARAVLPGLTYTDQETLVRIQPRMPEGSWLGVIVRAASENDDFSATGPQTMLRLHRQPDSGRVSVRVHEGSSVVYSGPFLDLADVDPDAGPMSFRVRTEGDTVHATVNGFDALQGGFTGIPDPAGGGYTSLRTIVSSEAALPLRVDYVLVREAGAIPDVHFDADGKLWLSMLEEDNSVPGTVDPGSFLFQHQTLTFGLSQFVGFVLPLLDYVDFDDDHLLLGVVDSPLNLASGSETVLAYKGQVEGAYKP